MEENKLFHERYFLERLLGRGNFSEVWLAKDTKTDIHVALKIYAPATGLDDNGLNVLAREFSLVANMNHKNLLKPLYYDVSDRKPYLVLPYCEEGSIMNLVGKMTEKEAWRLLRDVASGLAWMHSFKPPVIHQDIKPDNVMIGPNGDFMITDFGVSTHVKSTLRKSMSQAFSSAGTIAYMAPERFSKDNTPIMANDIYSLGATVYEMLSGDTPFGDDGGLVQKKGADVPDLPGNYSAQMKKLLSKCLMTNPWERPTAEQLEKYAEAGLEGKTIKFADEKGFAKKKGAVIAAAAVIVLAIAGVSAYVAYDHARQAEAVAAAQQAEAKALAAREQAKADSLKLAEAAEAARRDSIAAAESQADSAQAAAQLTAKAQSPAPSRRPAKGKAESTASSGDHASSQEETITKVHSQEPKETLSLSETYLKFKGKGGTKTVSVTCSGSNWEVHGAPSWMTCTKKGSGQLVVETEKNKDKKERSATLTIRCGKKAVTLIVIQDRFKTLGII